jgi:glycosyltransferase involved in cell wall biosynthesis
MSWVARLVEKLMVILPFDEYVAISHATHRDLLEEKASETRTRVIYPGVDEPGERRASAKTGDLRQACGIGHTDFLYLYYGRPGVTKGVELLVEAAPQVQRQIPDAHLALILADEPRENYVRICRFVTELKSTANIHLVPRVPPDARMQLVRYLLDADCIVVPSLTEGFGLTTAEACVLGIPVVASRAGAIPEVISGHHILVEPGSSSALSAGVVRAWSGQYDYLPPKQFLWSDMVDQYESLYQELLGRCT